MREIVNQCVSCGLPCLGEHCPNMNIEVIYCDNCEESDKPLYEYEGGEYCYDCIIEMIEEVPEKDRYKCDECAATSKPTYLYEGIEMCIDCIEKAIERGRCKND